MAKEDLYLVENYGRIGYEKLDPPRKIDQNES